MRAATIRPISTAHPRHSGGHRRRGPDAGGQSRPRLARRQGDPLVVGAPVGSASAPAPQGSEFTVVLQRRHRLERRWAALLRGLRLRQRRCAAAVRLAESWTTQSTSANEMHARPAATATSRAPSNNRRHRCAPIYFHWHRPDHGRDRDLRPEFDHPVCPTSTSGRSRRAARRSTCCGPATATSVRHATVTEITRFMAAGSSAPRPSWASRARASGPSFVQDTPQQ